MKQLHLMIETLRGLTKNVKQLILRKNEMHKKYANKNKDAGIFD